MVSFAVVKSYWKLSAFDYFCGTSSLAALALWYATKEPNLAIIFAIIADGFAAVPTIKKSWLDPETESPIAYITGLFSVLTSFFVITAINFSELAFPVYLVALNCFIIFSLYRKKFFTYQT